MTPDLTAHSARAGVDLEALRAKYKHGVPAAAAPPAAPPRTAKEQAHLEKCHARLDTWKVCLMCGGEGQRNETHNFIVRKSNCDHCEGEGMLCSDPLLNTVAKREAARRAARAEAAAEEVAQGVPPVAADDLPQPPKQQHDAKAVSRAHAHVMKSRGDALMGAGDFAAAAGAYTAALVAAERAGLPSGAALGNRALAHLKAGEHDAAVDDCTVLLAELEAQGKGLGDKAVVKARLRRCAARCAAQKDGALAVLDADAVLAAEPQNPAALKSKAEAVALAAEDAARAAAAGVSAPASAPPLQTDFDEMD